jgi:hypothetical protein
MKSCRAARRARLGTAVPGDGHPLAGPRGAACAPQHGAPGLADAASGSCGMTVAVRLRTATTMRSASRPRCAVTRPRAGLVDQRPTGRRPGRHLDDRKDRAAASSEGCGLLGAVHRPFSASRSSSIIARRQPSPPTAPRSSSRPAREHLNGLQVRGHGERGVQHGLSPLGALQRTRIVLIGILLLPTWPSAPSRIHDTAGVQYCRYAEERPDRSSPPSRPPPIRWEGEDRAFRRGDLQPELQVWLRGPNCRSRPRVTSPSLCNCLRTMWRSGVRHVALALMTCAP